MKKLLLTLLSAVCATTLFAQSPFVVSPSFAGSDYVQFQGVAMSQNHLYAAGEDAYSRTPALWNASTGEVFVLVETVTTPDGAEAKTGSFMGINDNGIAVGTIEDPMTSVSKPIMADIRNIDGYSELYSEASDQGAAAWGITQDGSIIVGYHFSADWTTHACIWTNNGQTRTDLPLPTAAQMGIEIDYVSARWISDDGSTILGYAQSGLDGEWVAMAWRRVNGSYEPVCFSNGRYESWLEAGSTPQEGVYFTFEPVALSADGQWASLRVIEAYDPDDWDYVPLEIAARYNFNTNTLEVLHGNDEYMFMEAFGISNNGTVVGRATTQAQEMTAFFWVPGADFFTLIDEAFPNDEYVLNQVQTAFSGINADASYVLGYAINGAGDMTSFIVNLHSANLGIDDVHADRNVEPRIKGTYDLMGRKIDTIRHHGIYIIDGKKVIR